MSNPRRFVFVVWTNLKWVVAAAEPIPRRWSAEMRPGEGKKTNYKIRGTVLDASGNLFNVLLIPVTREGVANWSCSCGSDSDSPTPCRHTAMIAREWVQHLESLPERRKLVDWLKAEERNTPQ